MEHFKADALPDMVDDILKLSKSQCRTCMYTKKELETFPQERLNTICQGIAEIKPWVKRKGKIAPLRKQKKRKVS